VLEPSPIKPSYQFVLPKYSLNNCADRINMVIDYQSRFWNRGKKLFHDDIVYEFGEITQIKGHYAVQGHSRSPILVPIESSYTTSCYSD